jgi:hypothetical protein
MSDQTWATKRLRSAFKHGKRTSIAEVTREFTEVVEHQKWQEEGFESLPHWVLDKDGLAVRDEETTSRWVKGLLKDGFVDQWVKLLDEIAITRRKPRAKVPLAERLGFERFWTLGTGNDQDRLLLRLYRERSDLYESVIKLEMTIMTAAIKAGWRKETVMGRRQRRYVHVETLSRLVDEEQLMATVRKYLRRSNGEARARWLELNYRDRTITRDDRVEFLARNVPGVDARRAAKAAENTLDLDALDNGKVIEGRASHRQIAGR